MIGLLFRSLLFRRGFEFRHRLLCSSRLKRSLCGRKPRDRNAERRAADVIETYLTAETDGSWIAAMFAADTDFQTRLGAAAAFGADAHQLAHAVAVQHLKRIFRHDLVFNIVGNKSRRVI